MDCDTLIKQIENKFSTDVGSAEESQNSDPADMAKRSASFLEWFENLINNGLVDSGETVESAKKCILKTLEADPEGLDHPFLQDALSIFSDKRLTEIFGVKIFANLDE